MPEVTIIIPVYNAGEFLSKCIYSVLASITADDEVILVDDGSTDNSGLICADFIELYPNLKYIYKENGGVSSARNCGLANAKGNLIGFVDADDYVDKDYRDTLVRLVHDSDLAVCGFNRIVDSKQKEELEYKLSSIEIETSEKDVIVQHIINNVQVQGFLWNKLFRKDIIYNNNIMFHDDVYICEDLLFCLSYVNFCSKVKITTARLYNYLDNKESALNKVFNPKHLSLVKAFRAANSLPYITQSSRELLANVEIRMLLALLKKYYTDHTEDGVNSACYEILVASINSVGARVSIKKIGFKFRLAYTVYKVSPRLFNLFRLF